MSARKILIGTGVAVAVLAGTAVVWSAVWPTGPSYAAGVVARNMEFGGGHGHWSHGDGHGMAMICSDERDRRLEHGLAFVEGFGNFTPEQTAAWNELASAIRAGSATIGEKCRELDQAGVPQTAPERLARFESMATTGLEIVKNVRPAFDDFYATLSDKQKKALDDLSSHHGRRS